jgi:hypothetical protein
MTGLYEQYTDKLLFESMRKTSSTSFDYIELKAELDRRIAEKTIEAASAQVEAASAQVRSAWWQLGAMIAMFLTVIAAVAVPLWLAPH